MIAILVPVVFGLMGFAVDLGRIYMIKGELKSAADAMALAAAQQLAGTDVSIADATAAAQLAAREAGGFSNRYDFGGRPIGEQSGILASEVQEPAFFETVESAIGTAEAGGAEAGGSNLARHVRMRIQADAPLLFWGFLSLGLDRRTPVLVEAVAGISAPLCTACGIEPLAVAALDPAEDIDFGFIVGTRYTLGYQCNGPGAPGPLPGTIQRVPYLLINRLNEEPEIFAEESTQVLRIGAVGLPSSSTETQSCVSVNSVEAIWQSATSLPCNQNQVPGLVTALLCGFASRLESGVVTGCENIPEVDAALAPVWPDSDTSDVETYQAYTGNRRRVITIPVVDSIGDPQAMTVLGFRQFLIQPAANQANLTPTDNNGRFIVTYIGSSVPVRQGRFTGCTVTNGPGKVVLHK